MKAGDVVLLVVIWVCASVVGFATGFYGAGPILRALLEVSR